MKQKVVLAINQKWPGRNQNTLIQQDSTLAHIDENDPQFVVLAASGVWYIALVTQSPKLPDLNVLDLPFFPYSQNNEAWDLQRQWTS